MKKLIEIYQNSLNGYADNKKADLDSTYLSEHERLSHLIFMLDTMKNETDEGKLNRWVGFIQGVLWAHGWWSINDLRNDVISCTIKE